MIAMATDRDTTPIYPLPGEPLREVVDQHEAAHQRWRYFGYPPAQVRLYELWSEIEAEDKERRERRG